MRGLFPKGELIKNAATLISGTIAGQALTLLCAPLLTRIYPPEHFGMLGIYVAMLAVLVLVASLRYELAIPLADSDEDARSLVFLCLSIVVVFVILGIAGTSAFGSRIASITNAPELPRYLWILPLGILAGGSHKVFTYWALRKKAFAKLSITRFQQDSSMVGTQIGIGLIKSSPLGLILGHAIGFSAGLLNLANFFNRDTRNLTTKSSFKEIASQAKRYKNFPLFSSWSAIANVTGSQLPLILFASLFSPAIAGFYMLAHRVANAPVAIISDGTGKAFMTAAVAARKDNTVHTLSFSVFKFLLQIGVAPLAVLAVVAPELFKLLFGPNWIEAGQFMQYLTPSIAAVFVFVPISSLFAVLERQKADLAFQVSLLTVRVASILIAARIGTASTAVGSYSLAATVVYVSFGIWLLTQAGTPLTRVLIALSVELTVAAVVATAILLLKQTLLTPMSSFDEASTWAFIALVALVLAALAYRARGAMAQLHHITANSQTNG